MTGPLHILRQAFKDGVTIDDSNPEFLQIGDTKLYMTDLTEYHRKRGGDTPYTLDAVWFMYKHREQAWGDYLEICKRMNHDLFIFQDKVEILKLLTVETTIKGIPEEVPEPVHEPEIPVAPVAEPVARADRPVIEAPREFAPSMDLPISTRPAFIEEGRTVEYERLRPLDSVILCANDFSDMRVKNDVIDQQSRYVKSRAGEFLQTPG
jgi:hypothetical protein